MQANVYHRGLGAKELAAQLHELVAVRRQSLWLMCRYLADMADGGGYRDLDYPDVLAFAWRELGMPLRRTRERIRVGRALRVLPDIERAFVEGQLGFARVRELVRVATPATEAEWLQAALDLPRRSLEALVARCAAAASDEPADPRPARRSPGTVEVKLRLPEGTWRRLEEALDAARAAEGAPLSAEAAFDLVARVALQHLAPPLPDLGDEAGEDPGVPMGTPGKDAPEVAPDPEVPEVAPDPEVPVGTRVQAPPVADGIRPMGAAPDCAGPPPLQLCPQVESDGPFRRSSSGPEGEAVLSDEAVRLLDRFPAHQVCSANQLCTSSGLEVSALLTALAQLEIYGYLERTRSGYRLIRWQAPDEE